MRCVNNLLSELDEGNAENFQFAEPSEAKAEVAPPNYAKCVEVLNSTPVVIKGYATYKELESDQCLFEKLLLEPNESHVFEEKTKNENSFQKVIPIHRIAVMKFNKSHEGHEGVEHLIQVKGVQGCVKRVVKLGDDGKLKVITGESKN